MMERDMFFTQRKLELRMEEIGKYRYRDRMMLDDFWSREDVSGVTNPEIPQMPGNRSDAPASGWKTMKIGEHWSGRDRYLWLMSDIDIPQEWAGRQVVGVFDFGLTGGGGNSGFESMLYLDGSPYQGVDGNHKEVFFREELIGKHVPLVFRLWSGLEGGGVPRQMEHQLKTAELAWLDAKTDHLYYLGSMIAETCKVLGTEQEDSIQMKLALNQAICQVDWTEPGSEAFYQSLHTAYDLLEEKISAMEKHTSVCVHTIGHTHIDMAWLWRLKHTHEKAGRSFSTVLRLMEQYPEYIFLQTQPQIYQYVKEDYPEIYAQMKARIQEGRWESDGGMWIEADCNLTSGESLTRQILLGGRFFREEFGREISYLWLPDVFGYSWALPQILKKAGIPMFMTTKISWNQYNRMPHDTFVWKGLDGSEILTHFITTPEPNQVDSSYYTYNGDINPASVTGIWEVYRDKEVNQELLLSYGYGDGGGGVNRDMLERRRALDQLPGIPHVKTSTAGEYFDRLQKTFADTDQYVHTWDGELYLEYHRGTYTSHAHNKRMNRKMELLYREAEWFTVMQGIYEHAYGRMQQEKLTEGWRHILTNQFHDIIPGSSIREVYEDSREDYIWVEQQAKEVEEDFLEKILDKEEHVYSIWNPLGWKQDTMVSVPMTVPAAGEGFFVNEAGEPLVSQPDGDCVYVAVKNLPSMGISQIRYVENKNQAEGRNSKENQKNLPKNMLEGTEPFQFDPVERCLETPYYQVTFTESGQMARLYDKTYNREILAAGSCGNILQIFEDKPMHYDAWDIDLFYQEKMEEVSQLEAFEATAAGALMFVLHLSWRYHASTIEQNIRFYAADRRINFETTVDYHERHKLLKVAFPLDIRTSYATYDIQYGNVRRPNHWNTSWDQARFESVAHRFADLSEHAYGVSLLNDCKYGYDIKDNVLRLSLLKAATHPDCEQDQGMHVFTYALYPHGGDFIEGGTVQEAAALNCPAICVAGASRLPFASFLTITEGAHVEIDAIKKSEDGTAVIVRLHEYAGEREEICVTPGVPIDGWQETDLQERAIGPVNQTEMQMVLKPYEIKTFRMYITELKA